MEYTSITSWGIPFLLVSSGGNSLIRSDGSPTYSMLAVLLGAILNTVLDPLFMFVFHMGMAGAAWATVLSQVVSGITVALYLRRFKQVQLEKDDFRLDFSVIKNSAALGLTPMINTLSVTIVQIISNNLLRTYGALSVYGAEIPIAVSGIVAKLNMVYSTMIVGLSQGSQPILGYNYGAKNYGRVRETYRLAIQVATVISIVMLILFEVFAPQIMSLFGSDNTLYLVYGTKYLRIFLGCLFLNGMQISSTTFFSAIGKAKTGALISMTKQIFLLLPLLFLFVNLGGIEQIMWAGPVADLGAWAITMYVVYRAFEKITQAEMGAVN